MENHRNGPLDVKTHTHPALGRELGDQLSHRKYRPPGRASEHSAVIQGFGIGAAKALLSTL